MKRTLLFTIIMFLLSACAPTVLTPSPEDIQTAIAETQAAAPSATPAKVETEIPAASATPVPPTITPTPIGPISGEIIDLYLYLRAGPSTYFDTLALLEPKSTVTALGKTNDNGWVFVETVSGGKGWMFAGYLTFAEDYTLLPEVVPDNSVLLYGRVENQDGEPITGIGIAVINREEDLELRGDVTSDAEGRWEIYVPINRFTIFDIQIVSYNPQTTNILDANGNKLYYELDNREFLTLPQEEDVVFIYQAVTRDITGVVLDVAGEPVPDAIVGADRDDGATAATTTDAEGNFTLKADSGVWDVYAVLFNPDRTESEHLTVEIAEDDPDPIELVFTP